MLEAHHETLEARDRLERGPNARAILNEVVKDAVPETVLSNKRFPWLSWRNIELGMCPVRAVRVW